MKGLLLKDFYMILKYCRTLILVPLLFLAIFCFGNDNGFFAVYPTLFAGIIPLTLISYEEREKWNEYCLTLPCSRARIVSEKYLIGLLLEIFMIILSAAAQAYKLSNAGAFEIGAFMQYIATVFIVGLIGPTLLLPFVFRLGAEKGRVAYYVLIGILCVGTSIVTVVDTALGDFLGAQALAILAPVAAVALYILSWLLSIRFYKKREI